MNLIFLGLVVRNSHCHIRKRRMPTVTNVVKSMLPFSHYRAHGQPSDFLVFSRLGLLIGSIIAFCLLVFLLQQIARLWRAAQSNRTQLTTTSQKVTWSSQPSTRWILTRQTTYCLESLVQPRQGQGLFQEQAKDARISIGKVVYRGLPTPAGLGGAVEGSGRMMSGLPEEVEAASDTSGTTRTSRSRGVSKNVSDASFAQSSAPGVLSLSFNGSPPIFPAADEYSRDHVGVSRRPSPSSFMLAGASSEEGEAGFTGNKGKSMEVAPHFGGVSRDPNLVDTGSENEAHMSTTIYSPFGYPMTDDEHVSYNTANEYYSSVSTVAGEASAYQHTDLDFSRPPVATPLAPPTFALRPLYPQYRTHQIEDRYSVSSQQPSYYSPSVPMRTNDTISGGSADQELDDEYVPLASPSKTRVSGRGNKSGSTSKTSRSKGSPKTKGHAKSIPIPSNAAASSIHGTRRNREYTYGFHTSATLSPSSFPSTSPSLPPPPPNSEYRFDPSEVMFPGGMVRDGGIRMVPTYDENAEEEETEQHAHNAGCSSTGVQGESSNVVDGGFGGGWERHTQVYSGGGCLLCAKKGGGGYYGARVRPEDKRH